VRAGPVRKQIAALLTRHYAIHPLDINDLSRQALWYYSNVPTIYREGPYRFFFWSNENAANNEPPHVHVERDDDLCKYWLQPVSLAYNDQFAGHELSRIEEIVIEKADLFVDKWNEYFG